MTRKQKHEEHLNHEAWAIPYADLITLLLAFFVVMYAISSVNEGKYRVLSDAMVSAFNGAPTGRNALPIAQKAATTTGEGTPAAINLPLLSNLGHSAVAPLSSKNGQDSASVVHHAEPSTSAAETEGADTALTLVANSVEHAMHDLVARNLVAVRRSNSAVEVEIRTDILFPSGSATLAPTAIDILARLAESLRSVPNPIRVEGHTDDRPISTITFPSNWELSAARASSVVHLFSSRNIEPARLAVIGLSEYRPVKTNATPEGRNANRRVVIVILSPDSAKDSAPVSAVQPAAPVAATFAPPCKQWHGSCTT
jgi:chemotaxis protein MotB